MVKDLSDSERGNPLLPHGVLFPISSKGYFICIRQDNIRHDLCYITQVVEHWLEREIAQWGGNGGGGNGMFVPPPPF